MEYILSVILFIILGIIVFQDFKNRAISWFLIPVTLGLGLWYAIRSISTTELLINVGVNIIIIAFYVFSLTIYFSLKNKRLVNLTHNYLGWGDILFFISLSPFFSPLNFIVFNILGFLLTLMVSVVVLVIKKPKEFTIPLAGALALIFSPLFAISFYLGKMPLVSDQWLMTLMY